MSVKINIPSYLQYFTDNAEVVEVNGSSVKECLSILSKRFPELKKLLFSSDDELSNNPLNYVEIFLNGKSVMHDEITEKVKDGDELELTYVVLGG